MKSTPRRVVILGATKGMGRAVARRLAARGDRVFLLGMHADDLTRSASDLSIRGRFSDADAAEPGEIGWHYCDLEKPESFGPALAAADSTLGGFDTVVVTAALFATQEALEADPVLLARLLTIDFTNTVLFCEEARKRLLARGGGTLCVFSSVAGDRGRRPVALYGAAKAGLSRYLEALDHKHHGQGLRVITIKPGFVKTGMTAGLKPPPFAGEPDEVAARVVKAIDRGEPEVYAPLAWGPIMTVIKGLPRFVMRRIRFSERIRRVEMPRRFSGRSLVIASHNAGKIAELEALLRGHVPELPRAPALGLTPPEETAATFIGNAALKALTTARISGQPAIADDCGLCVRALGGAPGVYSARWAGSQGQNQRYFDQGITRIQRELGESPDLRATFHCALALAWPDGYCETVEGVVPGRLVFPPRGEHGFGYDSIFLPDGHTQTFGEMQPAQRDALNHRAAAWSDSARAASRARTTE